MLVSKMAKVRWNNYTKKHYVNKGYVWTKNNDYFDCLIKDLLPTSTVIVEVDCDYCDNGKSFKNFRNYLKSREIIQKDCCDKRECMVAKSEEVNLIKYGVNVYAKTEEYRNYSSECQRTSKDEVVKLADDKGLTILNIDDFINQNTKLYVICKNHKEDGIQETNLAYIKDHKFCCKFGHNENRSDILRLDGQFIYDEFIKNGLIPMFKQEDYERNNKPLAYKCPKHLEKGIQYKTYADLRLSPCCEFCAYEKISESKRRDENEVFSYFESRGLTVVENQKYINQYTHIFYICNKHQNHIQKSTFDNLKNIKVPCEFCRVKNSLVSLSKRMRRYLTEWKRNSEKECNYKCVLTGSNEYEIHHLYSFNNIMKEVLQELNIDIKEKYNGEEIVLIKNKLIALHEIYKGVCVRKDLHILFHQYYSKENNSKEQFDEFIERFNKGEFDEILNNKCEEVAI